MAPISFVAQLPKSRFMCFLGGGGRGNTMSASLVAVFLHVSVLCSKPERNVHLEKIYIEGVHYLGTPMIVEVSVNTNDC